MQVTVNITGFDEEGNPTEDVQGEIIETVARQLSRQIEHRVQEEIAKHFKNDINQRLSENIKDFLSTSIQPTNIFGENKGEPITLIEYITKTGVDYLKETCHQPGKNSSYSDPKAPRAHWIARDLASDMLRQELKPAIEKAKEEAKAFMVGQVASALKEAMAKAIK